MLRRPPPRLASAESNELRIVYGNFMHEDYEELALGALAYVGSPNSFNTPHSAGSTRHDSPYAHDLVQWALWELVSEAFPDFSVG